MGEEWNNSDGGEAEVRGVQRVGADHLRPGGGEGAVEGRQPLQSVEWHSPLPRREE